MSVRSLGTDEGMGMKRKAWLMGALVMLCASSAMADAWVVFMSARVTAIVQWQDNADVLFEVAPQTYCYVPANEKTAIALITTLYSSGREADIHCHAASVSVGGMSAHRAHRIIAR